MATGWSMRCALIDLNHVLAAVFRVADQALSLGIDDKIESLQRKLANQDRTSVGHFGDVAVKDPLLKCQPHGTVHCRRAVSCRSLRDLNSVRLLEPQLRDAL